MERSFARAVRYGFRRARWRRLWRIQIQEYITAAIQNIQVLIKHGNHPLGSAVMAISVGKAGRNVLCLCSKLSLRVWSVICHKRKTDAEAFCFLNYLHAGI
jgi:hypothetical protein